jgi:hypothetical protein
LSLGEGCHRKREKKIAIGYRKVDGLNKNILGKGKTQSSWRRRRNKGFLFSGANKIIVGEEGGTSTQNINPVAHLTFM